MSLVSHKRPTVQRHRIDPTVDERPFIPKNKRAPRFAYVHYAHSWEYVAEVNPETGEQWGFLPKLKKVLAVPGANGVRDGNGGRIDITPAITGHTQKGAKYIDPTDARLGDEYQFYVGYIETNDGGRHFTEPGEEMVMLPGGRALPNSDEVIPIRRAFEAHLRDTGIVDPLLPEVKNLIVANARRMANRIGARLHKNPHLQEKYDGWLRIADEAEKAWPAYAEQFHATPSTPRPRTARRRKIKDE